MTFKDLIQILNVRDEAHPRELVRQIPDEQFKMAFWALADLFKIFKTEAERRGVWFEMLGIRGKGSSKVMLVLAFVGASAACSGGGSGPNVPTDVRGKLTGTWNGTLIVSRRNVPDVVGQISWTFAVDSAAPVNGYRVQVLSQHPWLPFSSTAVSVLDVPGGSTSPIYTHGAYTSPRGCSETFSSQGMASDQRIDASFSSADCDSQTFTGSVSLTRSAR
jgi:hypothetical protein